VAEINIICAVLIMKMVLAYRDPKMHWR